MRNNGKVKRRKGHRGGKNQNYYLTKKELGKRRSEKQ